MNTTRKNRSLREGFAGLDKTIQQAVVDGPRDWLTGARDKLRHMPKTNFDLGCDFAESGLWMDAVFRFKLAVWLQPNYPQAWYNLGCCYMRLNKNAKAVTALKKALAQKPNHADAIFMLSALDPASVPPNLRPTRMQKQVVIDFFTPLAPSYDAIAQQNQYAGPRLLFDGIKPLLKHTNGLHVLDLGCGTGLLSRPWRTMAVEISGVDCCPAMISVAGVAKINDKPLFDTLLTEDILALGEGKLAAKSVDVILLGDTAQFLGDLAPAFRHARLLKPGGLFAITVEPFGTPAGFGVNAVTGRFGHHPEYVKKTAAAAGLELKKEARVNLYAQLSAQLFIFAAKEGA